MSSGCQAPIYRKPSEGGRKFVLPNLALGSTAQRCVVSVLRASSGGRSDRLNSPRLHLLPKVIGK